MKIEKIDVLVLRAPRKKAYWGVNYVMEQQSAGFFRDYSTGYPLRVRSMPLYTADLTAVLVKVTTDSGLVGWGESKGVVVPAAVKSILVDMVIPAVIGMDALDIALVRERMVGLMRLRGHLQGFFQEAISGVEIALWDLKGKAAGLPVYSLLGGAFRDRIATYASGLVGLKANYQPADIARIQEDARQAMAGGFRGLKIAIGAGSGPDLASVDAVREVVGDDFAILVDAGGCYDFHTALRVAEELQRRRVFWFEAPLPIDDFQGYIELAQRVAIPITNDLIWTTGLVRDILQRGGKVIFLPEVLKAGGLLECKQIADLLDRFHLPFAPHLSQGTMLQFAATAHICAAAPNFLICEYWWQSNPLGNAILKRPLEMKEGFLMVPEGPGLGVEMDEAALAPFIVN
jgi:L-alanine-DL-glutamate epimerase-like enolase superfamily enzyme